MSELNRMTIAQARKGMAEGSFSSVELTQSCVNAMDSACGSRCVHHADT